MTSTHATNTAQCAAPIAPYSGYEQLAIIYGKKKRYDDEIRILEQYESPPKAPGVRPAKLAERLKKAREKRDGYQARR